MPRYGWYGDDFTGATDTLACLAQAGRRAMLFLGVPSPQQLEAAGPLDAVGIAGASRSMTPEAMAPELAGVGRFFAELGVRVLHYKCCSTFDSAPGRGSIGEAVRVLRPLFPNPLVPIIGGQPNIGRYCAFSNVFAAAGSGDAVHRLDRHPTMVAHPVTPMTEADLRRHLAQQGLQGVAGVHYPVFAAGSAEVASVVWQALQDGAPAVLFDVTSESDLVYVGKLIWSHAQSRPLLAVGASSVAQAIISAWPREAGARAEALPPAQGPVFVTVGSLSPVTQRQVESSPSYAKLALAAEALDDPDRVRAVQDETTRLLRLGHSVMVQTSPPGGSVDSAVAGRVARGTATFIAHVTRSVPLERIGIAGGDTSSLAALSLGIWGLTYRTTLGPGVTVCETRSELPALDGVELMLKGGQMGSSDLFEQLVHGSA